jgi:imidazolonepropionase-like amidohydrolase
VTIGSRSCVLTWFAFTVIATTAIPFSLARPIQPAAAKGESARSERDGHSQSGSPVGANTALLNGHWFNGRTFEARAMYSVAGRFTSRKPLHIDRTLDLSGLWIVPPFAEAHNHNIYGVSEENNRKALKKYLADGVFYIQIQGNYPLTDEQRSRLPMNRPEGPDVALGQTFLTSTGGHPIFLHETILMSQGIYPGFTKEQLRDKLYFTIDSESDLEAKWPQILKLRPDFIKTNLWCSDEYEKRRDDPAYYGRRALDPHLLPKIVAKAHASGLRVSVHIANAADFHYAVAAGVDEIAHMTGPGDFKIIEEHAFDPNIVRNADLIAKAITEAWSPGGAGNSFYTPTSVEDVKLAARRGIVVITTVAAPRAPQSLRSVMEPVLIENLKLMRDNGVPIAIGSDNPFDSSVIEADYIQRLGVFDNLTMLKMWTDTTARAIFPKRMIGALKEGYEASFLALEGNPLEDWQNVRRIKLRFKQGSLLEP